MKPDEILEMMNQVVKNTPAGEMRMAEFGKLVAAKKKETVMAARLAKQNKSKQGKNHE
jgi:hypothetical protein